MKYNSVNLINYKLKQITTLAAGLTTVIWKAF